MRKYLGLRKINRKDYILLRELKTRIEMLNAQKGNMYGFITHTWNAIKGKCVHDCDYCYMKRFPQKDLYFDEKELKTDLGSHKVIFVGSSTDMFARNVDDLWIMKVLEHCNKYPENTYLFQTKDPIRFTKFEGLYPKNTILGTTLESNTLPKGCQAPSPRDRAFAMSLISRHHPRMKDFPRMVTIEPIMDFDEEEFIELIKECKPTWVNIGADSNKERSFKEPSKEKILKLIANLRTFTEIKKKNNLERLL